MSDDKDRSVYNSSITPIPGTDRYSSLGTVLFNHGMSGANFNPVQALTKQMTDIILSVYQHRVDVIIKVLHWPSVIAAIQNKDMKVSSYVERQRTHALECAIHFTALCTMTEVECEQLLCCSRSSLIEYLRMEAESSMSNIKLLEHPDLIVLQAFAIYLVSKPLSYLLRLFD